MINFTEINTYLLNEVRLLAAADGIPISVVGASYPKEDAFIKYSTLLVAPRLSRPGQIRTLLHVELMCYHRHAGDATNGKVFGHLEMAQRYIHLYHQRRVNINNTCLQFTEARMIPLDLKAVGQFSQAGSQPSSSLNLNVAVIESYANINQRI